jgi:hypothetical protein
MKFALHIHSLISEQSMEYILVCPLTLVNFFGSIVLLFSKQKLYHANRATLSPSNLCCWVLEFRGGRRGARDRGSGRGQGRHRIVGRWFNIDGGGAAPNLGFGVIRGR